MNKFIVVLALVSACVAVASGNFHHRGKLGHRGGHQLHHGDEEFEHEDFDGERFHEDREFDRFGGHGHGHGLGHRHGLRHQGFGHKGGFEQGHGFGRRGGFEHGHGLGHGGFRGGKGEFGGHRGGHFGGRRVSLGGVRGNQESFGNLESQNHIGADKFAEGHEGSLLAGKQRFNADRNTNDIHDREGRRKHKVINKDVTIIKGKETGVDDETDFKNVDAHQDNAHVGASKSGVAAQEAGGSVGSRLDVDRDTSATGGQGSSFAAGAASI